MPLLCPNQALPAARSATCPFSISASVKRLLLLFLSLHLLGVSFLPGADAHELAEASKLWQHHETEHAGAGFWDFFYDHYLSDTHRHPNSDEHRSLPFHHAHACGMQLAFFLAAKPWHPAPLLVYALTCAKKPRPTAEAAPTGMARRCWQPPRA